MEASRIATGTNDDLRIEIHGREGALRFNLMEPNWLYVYDNRAKADPLGGIKGYTLVETVQRYPEPAVFPGPKFTIGWTRFHIACLYNFLSNVEKEQPSTPTLFDGYKIQEIMEAALKSTITKKWESLINV